MESNKPKPEEFSWHLTDHICRACYGRLLVRTTFDKRKVYLCSNCEIEREGTDASVMCCCGTKWRRTQDAGIRCHRNASRSPEMPQVIVASQISNVG